MIDVIKDQLQSRIVEERQKKRRRSLIRTVVIVIVICVLALQVVCGISVVNGDSMKPGISDGDIAIFYRLEQDYQDGDIVIAKVDEGEVIKRIEYIENGEVYLIGDNAEKSIDSRDFGTIPVGDVIGKVAYVIRR